jgi:lipopolysaccharide export system protein LptA
MFRFVAFFFLTSKLLLGIEENEVRIEANIFEANEKDRVSIFSGNVKIKKGIDELNSSAVKIYFDETHQPIKYEVLEKVSFKLYVREDSTYLGKADKVYLFPNTKKYIFSGDVSILEIESDRRIEGNRVSLDVESGSARIIGNESKPVVMSFKIEAKKSVGEKSRD